jgi:hypothetical protein
LAGRVVRSIAERHFTPNDARIEDGRRDPKDGSSKWMLQAVEPEGSGQRPV